jgi:hypothetical protein
MNNKSLTVGLIVVAIIAIIGVGYGSTKSGSTGPQGPKGEQGVAGKNGQDGVTTVRTVTVAPSPVLGAVAGPDSYFEYYNDNGVITANRNARFNQATTTICSIKSPYATSTLTFASANFSVSSTSSSIIDFAKSVNPGATTTKIGSTYSIVAGAKATVVASTTAVAGDAVIFPPNNYLVVNMKGGETNVFSPTGACNAVWKIN